MPKQSGVCKNGEKEKNLERYYYDSKKDQCLMFIYSGCEGNLNNFETITDCQEVAKKCTVADAPA